MIVENLVNTILDFVIGMIDIILLPIDLLISSVLPSLSVAFSHISIFLNYILSSISWVLSCFGLSDFILSFIIAYYIFKLTYPLIVYTIKLAIKWYNALKF